MKTKIKGTYYLGEEICQYLKNLSIDSELKLEHEPENKFDSNAIKVKALDSELGEIHLGYIDKQINEQILELMNKKEITVLFKGKYEIEINEKENKKFNIIDLGVF